MPDNRKNTDLQEEDIEEGIDEDESCSEEGGLELPDNQRQAVMQQKNTSLSEYYRSYGPGTVKS